MAALRHGRLREVSGLDRDRGNSVCCDFGLLELESRLRQDSAFPAFLR